MKHSDDESQGPVIRDRRRIDPQTGQVRDTAGQGQPRPGKHSASRPGGPAAAPAAPADPTEAAGPADGASSAGGAATADETAIRLAERTADLQRLQAEYANYRKRVERDRLAVREQALANVLSELLPVLDDIGRAREHGELSGGFKSVAESLEGIAVKLGLSTFGEGGDPFDPTLHDALMHSYSADVTETTCVQILQPGYKVGDRIIRPARVAVAEPGGDDGGEESENSKQTRDGQDSGDGEQGAQAAGNPDTDGDAAGGSQEDSPGSGGHGAAGAAG
jgi:molecular chaperone GrpE